jgi:hypothetical protein
MPWPLRNHSERKRETTSGHRCGSEVFVHGSPLHGSGTQKARPAGAAGLGVDFTVRAFKLYTAPQILSI